MYELRISVKHHGCASLQCIGIPIIDRNHDNVARAAEIGTVIGWNLGRRTCGESAAVQPDHDGAFLAVRDAGRSDVEILTVVVHRELTRGVFPRRIGKAALSLRRNCSVVNREAHVLPRRYAFGADETLLCLGVGNTVIGVDPFAHITLLLFVLFSFVILLFTESFGYDCLIFRRREIVPRNIVIILRTDRDVGEFACGRCTVPMNDIGRTENHIPRMQNLQRTALDLMIADAVGRNEHLPRFVTVPAVVRSCRKGNIDPLGRICGIRRTQNLSEVYRRVEIGRCQLRHPSAKQKLAVIVLHCAWGGVLIRLLVLLLGERAGMCCVSFGRFPCAVIDDELLERGILCRAVEMRHSCGNIHHIPGTNQNRLLAHS